MKAYERLLNYVKVPTPSNEKSGTHPSSECQRVLADQLAEEMKALGVSDVRVEDKCYVYGKFRQQRIRRKDKTGIYRTHGYGI